MKRILRFIGLLVFCVFAVAYYQTYKMHASFENKAGEVLPAGYVDLAPPTTFSPIRGVICEDLGDRSGICYDHNGPSKSLTAEHISAKAAANLNTKFTPIETMNSDQFITETNILCDSKKRECWMVVPNFFPRKIKAPKHSLALYGFD